MYSIAISATVLSSSLEFSASLFSSFQFYGRWFRIYHHAGSERSSETQHADGSKFTITQGCDAIRRRRESFADGPEFTQGEVDAAEKAYREALKMREDDPYACYHLGVLLRVTGRREEAIQCFEVAAAVDSDIKEKAQEALERLRRGSRTL